MKNRDFALVTERMGPLPLVNHFLDHLGIEETFERFVPTTHPRVKLSYAKALGILLRSILTEREPIYRLGEVVESYDPAQFGLEEHEAGEVKDDSVGRALERLFDADRGSMLTELVVTAAQEFGLDLGELHNDSTSIRFTGQYSNAKGRSIRGRRAPFITYGFSKDHRPDLKQLLFILTTTKDGAVPVQFRCEAGNESDSRTHEETWEALCRVTGRHDFLYVADGKLCNAEAMDHIDGRHGRFVTVIPRNRLEDKEFREWIQTHEPKWEKVRDQRNPRRKGGPRDRWYAMKYHIPSREAWPVIWVFGSLLRLKQEQARRERIARAEQRLEDLARSYEEGRPRKKARHEVQRQIDEILESCKVRSYVRVSLDRIYLHTYKQDRPGRPGPDTKYIRKTKRKWRITWRVDEDRVAYDHKSDGMFPLLTNDRNLTVSEVFEAYKRQPKIEKRFQQAKTVHEIAPVLLKNEDRIEALFFLYFIALLVQTLIERELRNAMKREGIEALPLYPEERANKRPTADQILKLFSLVQRNVLVAKGCEVEVFEAELTDLQKQILKMLGVPEAAYLRRR